MKSLSERAAEINTKPVSVMGYDVTVEQAEMIQKLEKEFGDVSDINSPNGQYVNVVLGGVASFEISEGGTVYNRLDGRVFQVKRNG